MLKEMSRFESSSVIKNFREHTSTNFKYHVESCSLASIQRGERKECEGDNTLSTGTDDEREFSLSDNVVEVGQFGIFLLIDFVPPNAIENSVCDQKNNGRQL